MTHVRVTIIVSTSYRKNAKNCCYRLKRLQFIKILSRKLPRAKFEINLTFPHTKPQRSKIYSFHAAHSLIPHFVTHKIRARPSFRKPITRKGFMEVFAVFRRWIFARVFVRRYTIPLVDKINPPDDDDEIRKNESAYTRLPSERNDSER